MGDATTVSSHDPVSLSGSTLREEHRNHIFIKHNHQPLPKSTRGEGEDK